MSFNEAGRLVFTERVTGDVDRLKARDGNPGLPVDGILLIIQRLSMVWRRCEINSLVL